MISGDFVIRWNAIIVRKGREKGQFWGISYFWIEVFLKDVLGLSSYLTKEPTSFPTFQVKARLYVTFIAVRKHNFHDSFLVLFCTVLCTKNVCCNDSKYYSLNWKDVSVTNVDIFEKEQFSLQFFYSQLQVYIVYRVSFIFHLRASSYEPGWPGWLGYRDELPWVHMRNFSPVSEMRKGQRSWGRVLAPNSGNKTNITKHKNFNFRAHLSIGNS